LGQGKAVDGDAIQPEVELMLDFLQGRSAINFSEMPHKKAEALRRMLFEFQSAFSQRPIGEAE